MTKSLFLLLGVLSLTAIAVSGTWAQRARKSVTAAEVNGTFKMNFTGKFRGHSNDVKILALGGGKIRVAFDLYYPYALRNGEISVNMGTLDGEAAIKGGTAVYTSDEFGPCKITIRFVRAGTIRVAQDGSDADCGFGHNVFASGTYRKASGKKPKLDSQ